MKYYSVIRVSLLSVAALLVSSFACEAPALGDGVADRQAAYHENYYNAFSNHSTLGSDADTTINVALTAIKLGKPQADIDAANAALSQYFTGKANYWDTARGDPASIDGYWASRTIASVLMDDEVRQHITADNQDKMKAYLFNLAQNRDKLDKSSVDANLRGRIYDSGNHDMHSRMVYWGAAQVLKNDPNYKDQVVTGGQTVEQRYGEWTTNLLDYFQDRAGKGGTVEVDATVYAATYHSPVFNIAEYAEDTRLKDISREYLTLHMADLAQKSTEGITGGAKSRAGKNRVQTADEHRSIQYLHLFTGEPDGSSVGDGDIPQTAQLARIMGGATTTDYRLPQQIIDMIADEDARGTYTYTTNRMGEGAATNVFGRPMYTPTSGQSSLVHTTRVTPDYTLGWFTLDENRNYMAISGQSQAFFAITDASPDSRLVMNLTGGKVNDELQGVGDGDAMMFRRQIGNHNGQTPRVYISDTFDYDTEADGWVFGTDASGSYFAIRGVLPTDGSTVGSDVLDVGSDGGPGKYLTYNNDDAVVVVQMGQATEYASFDAFKADIRDNSLTVNGGAVSYNPGDAGGELTMFNTRALPQVNGQAVDLTPAKTYDSPYLSGDYGASVITFTDLNGNSFDLDFDYNPVAPKQSRAVDSNTTLSNAVFSPGYREMVGVTELSSNDASPLTYTIDPTGVMQIDFDGFHNVMDKLTVNGTLALGGELLINMIRDTPTQAGTYQLFEADDITGSFATITLPTATGLVWDTDQLTVDGTIALKQTPTLTIGDVDNFSYSGSDPNDNPPVDAAFAAALATLSSNFEDLKGLDEGGNNAARAMTFTFSALDEAALESVVLEMRVRRESGSTDNENMRLDDIDNVRVLRDMNGYGADANIMTLTYEFTQAEFALLSDGQLNIGFIDDVAIDYVTLSWVESDGVIPEPGTLLLTAPALLMLITRRRRATSCTA